MSVDDQTKTKALVESNKIRKHDKYLSESFLKELFEKIDNIRDEAYIKFHVQTGIRVIDVVNAEWVHLDNKENKIKVYDHKKDAWRDIYFPENLKSTLNKWRLDCQKQDIKDKRIFPFSSKTANRILKHWCDKLGYKYANKVSSHWLRHTFIRLSRRAGRDMIAVRQNTGDTTNTILNWYEGYSSEDMRREIETKPLIQ